MKNENYLIKVTLSGDHLTIMDDDTNYLFRDELSSLLKNYSVKVEPFAVRGDRGIMIFGQAGVLYKLLFDLCYNFDLLVV